MNGALPIVLVGGRSSRFGRDKLVEPIGPAMLVDRAIDALRGVFGGPVVGVGACDARVAARLDGVIADARPGEGPIAGVLAGMAEARRRGGDGTVIVLAGDLPGIDAATVRRVWTAAAASAEGAGPGAGAGAWAVLASARPGDPAEFEPCVGVYRGEAEHALRAALEAGRRALREAIPAERRVLVAVEPGAVMNVNRPADLPGEYARREVDERDERR